MYIVNKRDILMGIPNGMAIPAGGRKASEAEIACFVATGEQKVTNMDLTPKVAEPPIKQEEPDRKGKK